MAEDIKIVLNDESGEWEMYDDTYDITIHFDNEIDADSFTEWLHDHWEDFKAFRDKRRAQQEDDLK